MSEYIETIIYIVITIGIIVAGFFKKPNKKKSTEPKIPKSSDERDMSAGEVLKEIFGREEEFEFPTAEKVYKPQVQKQKTKKEVIPAAPESLEYQLLKSRKYFKPKRKLKSYTDDRVFEEEVFDFDLENIDWKQVIIYSEILKPRF